MVTLPSLQDSFLFNQNDPNVSQELRRRMAFALLSQRKAHPKNIGEGLSAIGDALGDIGTMRSLAADDARANVAAAAAKPPGAPPVPGKAADAGDTLTEQVPGETSMAEDPMVVGRDQLAMAMQPQGNMPPPDTPPPEQAQMPPVGTPQPPPVQQAPVQMASLGGTMNDAGPQQAPLPAAPPVTRNTLAATLARPGGAQPNPTDAATPGSPPILQDPRAGSPDVVMAQAAPPPTVLPGSRIAPKHTPLQEQTDAGYIPPELPKPAKPKILPMDPWEVWGHEQIAKYRNTNPALAANAMDWVKKGEERRAKQQAQLDQEERDQQKMYEERLKEIEAAKVSQAGRQTEIRNVAAEARAREQANAFRDQIGGGDPATAMKVTLDSKTQAMTATRGLAASREALDLLERGVITGFGANQKLDIARAVTAIGLADKGDVIANTESFKGAMQPVIAAILHQTSGTSGLSAEELRFAQDYSAGKITLDAKTFPMLMGIINRGSENIVKNHGILVDTLFGGNEKQRVQFGVTMPERSEESKAQQWAREHPGDPRADTIRKSLGIR